MKGKRGCALKMAFLLHLLAFPVLVLGCVTPYWSRVEDVTSGEVLLYQGLFTSYNPDDGNWTFADLNIVKEAGSDKAVLYYTLAVAFALLAIFLQLFLVEAFAFALYNASCGRKYNPDWLMIFSLLSGLTGITTLILYEKFTGRSFENSRDIKLDYSRGFVIIFIAAAFLACFFTVCDRTAENKKK